MKPGRAFSLLTGVALLGGIAKFNEMAPAAQAALLGDAAETAQSWLQGAIVTYNEVTGTASPQQPVTTAAASQSSASQAFASQAAAPKAVAPGTAAASPATEGQGESSRRVAARTAESEPAQQGNPLWGLPLKQLSMTRDRPIFSPSRRPPPAPSSSFVAPVAVRTPVKPAEPARPTVSLLGTIIGVGSDDQFGVFLESATRSVVRLRIGEDHQGWVLRTIKTREATLVKGGEQPVVLQLAAPGDAPLPGLPGVAGGFAPTAVPLTGVQQPVIQPGAVQPGAVHPGMAQGGRSANPHRR